MRREQGEDMDDVVYTLGSGAEDNESESGSEASSDEEDEERQTFKRKWREAQEDSSSSEDESPSGKKRVLETDEPVTLADQEALALKLLGA